MDIGFSLSDYPDEALQVLDLDNDGTISPSEFVGFVEEGLRHEEANLTVPQEIKPIDDLMFKRANLEGVITAKVASGRFLRDVATWFSSQADSEGDWRIVFCCCQLISIYLWFELLYFHSPRF